MKAKGKSGSRRFSARLKWTLPTRVQAGLHWARKLCISVPAAEKAWAKAASNACHRMRRLFGLRYSAPAIKGVVKASEASSAGVGGSIPAIAASPIGSSKSRGRRRSAVTKRAAKSRHQTKTGGRAAPASRAPRRQSPSPLPRAKASRRRRAILASRSGASPLSSKTSLPCGVSRNVARTRPGFDPNRPVAPASATASVPR